ncbi:glycosyltransferase family 4 protein [Caballeronia sordidicola]|uniref:Glycosyltransferase n=1 Tax=Caballeronia sordidicola TaxID=196367 RepID=A0A2C9XUJ5_CABSO|nr:glycosyltransferase family 4 protein [Caballeronia sordidicola]OTP65523.1 Glycosyltransferase [Caballeronia sordidicola]
MKIVHLATHAQCNGNGTVNAMIDLACTQARNGHDVAVASSGGGYESLLRRHGVTHVLLQQSRQPWRVPAMIAGFGRLIERFNPDVVHAHMMTGALISRFGSMRRRFALVTTIHHDIQKSASLMRFGDRVIVVSHAVADVMLERGVLGDILSVIPSGTVGTPRHCGRPAPRPLNLHRPAVVSVSSMFERNGIADILHAFALVRHTHDAQLYLVGDGPDRSAMEMLAEELGIAKYVTFAGFVADPRSYLASADVFVFAPHQAPGPLILSEAREAGCAIVATKVDGVPEMLDKGTGVLVEPSQPQQLASKIGWLLMDSPVRAQYKERARRDLEKFSVERVCADHLAVYQRAIEERKLQEARQERGGQRTVRAAGAGGAVGNGRR